jgi:hypothetical protein
MIGKLADAADIAAAPVVMLALAKFGAPETVVFHMTGQLVIAADIVAAPVEALVLMLVLVLAAVGAPEVVVFHVASERQPAADTAVLGAGLGTEGLRMPFADMQAYMYC